VKSEIVTAKVARIANNPYRRLHAYPYIERKIEALKHSIEDVGLWPSVIARSRATELWDYELAFGHHRVETARRLGLTEIDLICEELTDLQMLQYMGRENLEDYDSSFLIQLESWEAALKSGLLPIGNSPQPIAIAKLLGWTIAQKGQKSLVMNKTARACHAAYSLIASGYHDRANYASLTVYAALDLAETTLQIQVKTDDKSTKTTRPQAEIDRYNRNVARGAADTAEQLRQGSIKQRDIRRHIIFNAGARQRGKLPPLFAVSANSLAEHFRQWLQTDAQATQLTEMEKVLPQITLLEDWEALERVKFELGKLAERAEGWAKRLIPPKDKIRHFKALESRET
jgi:hypothetical protein